MISDREQHRMAFLEKNYPKLLSDEGLTMRLDTRPTAGDTRIDDDQPPIARFLQRWGLLIIGAGMALIALSEMLWRY